MHITEEHLHVIRLIYIQILTNNTHLIVNNQDTRTVFPYIQVIASYYGHLQILKFTVERANTIMSEAIEIAASEGHLECVKYLCYHSVLVTFSNY